MGGGFISESIIQDPHKFVPETEGEPSLVVYFDLGMEESGLAVHNWMPGYEFFGETVGFVAVNVPSGSRCKRGQWPVIG
jgi:hypothetical protein